MAICFPLSQACALMCLSGPWLALGWHCCVTVSVLMAMVCIVVCRGKEVHPKCFSQPICEPFWHLPLFHPGLLFSTTLEPSQFLCPQGLSHVCCYFLRSTRFLFFQAKYSVGGSEQGASTILVHQLVGYFISTN